MKQTHYVEKATQRILDGPLGTQSKTPMVEAEPPVSMSPPVTPKLSQEDIEMVDGSVKTVLDLLVQFGFEMKNENGMMYNVDPTLRHWRACALEVGTFKFLKWKFAAFYASWMTYLYPDEPQDVQKSGLSVNIDNPGVLLGGRAYKFIRKLHREEPNLFYEFLQSVLFIKKGCPRPGKQLVLEGVKDAICTLTTYDQNEKHFLFIDNKSWADEQVHVTASGEVSDVPVSVRDELSWMSKEKFSRELARTALEVFKEPYTEDDRIEPFFPSTSANVNRSRTGGGAVGHIVSKFGTSLLTLRDKYGPQLVTFGKSTIKDTSLNVVGKRSLFVMDDSKLRSAFKELYSIIAKDALIEEPIVEPVGLQEALKVRVISKGPPSIYTVLKPLQKYMWRQVKNCPAGELVGQPVDKWYIQKILGAKLKSDERYLSVDYKDATNKMHKWVSSSLVKIIATLTNLTDEEELIFSRGLVDHKILSNANLNPITGRIDVAGPALEQKRGQLMGSVVSFPLLCIVNMTILRLAREYDLDRRLTLKDSGVMVNGDDGCLRVTQKGYDFWKKISQWVGLEPSVGKVYYSSKFLNMNSRTFVRDENLPFEDFTNSDGTVKLRQPVFKQVKFLNMGLFYGMERSVGGDTNAASPLMSVASRCRELIDGCPSLIKERVLRNYIKLHKQTLKKMEVPWFLPEHLGGLGLPIIPGTDLVPTNIDLRVARLIHNFRWISGEKESFVPPSHPSVKEWQMWALVARKLNLLKIDTSEAALNMQLQAMEMDKIYLLAPKVNIQTIGARLVVAELFNCKSLRYLKHEALTTESKTQLLEKYYNQLKIFNFSCVSNKLKPLSTVLPYGIENLPMPRPSVSELPIFPVINNIISSSKQSDITFFIKEDEFEQYLLRTNKERDQQEPWSKASIEGMLKLSDSW